MFDEIEQSRALAQPVFAFFFRWGNDANAFYAYTNAEDPIEVDGVTYRPVPIEVDSIKASGTLDKTNLEVRMDYSLEVPELYRIYPPTRPVTLLIRRTHTSDPDSEFITVWSGRVLSCSFDGPIAKLPCEPVATALRRAGLRRRYQLGCPLVLYGSECRADKEAATVEATVSSVGSSFVRLSADWTSVTPRSKYTTGIVAWTFEGETEVRTVLRVDGDGRTLYLSGGVRNLQDGDTVSVSLGCNRTLTDCENLHNNVQNFGGQPWIPLKNPFGFINLF